MENRGLTQTYTDYDLAANWGLSQDVWVLSEALGVWLPARGFPFILELMKGPGTWMGGQGGGMEREETECWGEEEEEAARRDGEGEAVFIVGRSPQFGRPFCG